MTTDHREMQDEPAMHESKGGTGSELRKRVFERVEFGKEAWN